MKPTFTNDSATIGSTEYSLPADSTTLAAQTDDCGMQAWIDLSAMTAGDQYQVTLYEKVNGGAAGVAWQAFLSGVQTEICVTPYSILGEGWDLTVKKLAGTDRSIAWSIRKLVEGESVVIGALGANAITAATLAADVATELQAGLATAAAVAAVAADVDDLQSRIPAALVGGRIDASIGAVAANAIDAAGLAADVTTELQAGLATSAALASAVAPLATTTELAAEAGALEEAIDDISARVPATLVDGRINASVGALGVGVASTLASAVWAFAHESGRTARGVLVRLDALIAGKATGLVGALATFYRADGTTPAIAASQDVEAGTRDAGTVAGD